jgi:hypothetical protein
MNNHSKDFIQIPDQTFDVAEGFFDPRTNIIYSYDKKEAIKRVDENLSKQIY